VVFLAHMAYSTPENSVEIDGDSEDVHEYGKWVA
jgi:hypothetical protein